MSPLLFAALLAASSAAVPETPPRQAVVIMHGLARDAASMDKLAGAVKSAGYAAFNLDYPSTRAAPAELTALLRAAVARCCGTAPRLHFVTHSLGGLIVRAFLAETPPANLGRVVMLAPPNHGSEIVDLLGGVWPFTKFFGPTAVQLGTARDSFPNRLPEPSYEVGIIAGDRPVNPLGAMVIPGSDDGGVSLEGAKLGKMSDFLSVHESHSRIMRSPEVAAQVLNFLRCGSFAHPDAAAGPGL
jgi:pimeloyl-ACP methyl ester carboxylesterase